MYDIRTPPGFGDQFYIYTYQPSAHGFVNGNAYSLIPIEVQDAAFVMRAHAGWDSVVVSGAPRSANGAVQVYDKIRQGCYQIPSILPGNFPNGQSVTPERIYPVNSAIRFDVTNVSLRVASAGGNNVPVDQLAFYGVRRFEHAKSDPEPSLYPFYEKEYDIPFETTLVSNGISTGPSGSVQFTIPIQDYDFELRRIEGSKLTGGVYSTLSPTQPEFAMNLYDSHWVVRSNAPVNSNRLIHYALSASNPMNTWPTPGIVYPINSVIRFDISSLIPATATLPTIFLTFKGVRRIPCH